MQGSAEHCLGVFMGRETLFPRLEDVATRDWRGFWGSMSNFFWEISPLTGAPASGTARFNRGANAPGREAGVPGRRCSRVLRRDWRGFRGSTGNFLGNLSFDRSASLRYGVFQSECQRAGPGGRRSGETVFPRLETGWAWVQGLNG